MMNILHKANTWVEKIPDAPQSMLSLAVPVIESAVSVWKTQLFYKKIVLVNSSESTERKEARETSERYGIMHQMRWMATAIHVSCATLFFFVSPIFASIWLATTLTSSLHFAVTSKRIGDNTSGDVSITTGLGNKHIAFKNISGNETASLIET